MIPYNLRKKLTKAGFPDSQSKESILWKGTQLVYPSLEELIKECGKSLYWIKRRAWSGQKDQWEARSIDLKYGFGRTPEEAVANLWLEIHKTKTKAEYK